MTINTFSGRHPAMLSMPVDNAVAITPDDFTSLDFATRALWVGGAGNISVTLLGSSAPVTLVGVTAGSLLPLRVIRVRTTGTTASSIVGLW